MPTVQPIITSIVQSRPQYGGPLDSGSIYVRQYRTLVSIQRAAVVFSWAMFFSSHAAHHMCVDTKPNLVSCDVGDWRVAG